MKTGVAGLIAYVIYATFHLPEGYWAVFTALVVTQANLLEGCTLSYSRNHGGRARGGSAYSAHRHRPNSNWHRPLPACGLVCLFDNGASQLQRGRLHGRSGFATWSTNPTVAFGLAARGRIAVSSIARSPCSHRRSPPEEAGFDPLRDTLQSHWLSITTALEESRSEPSFSRFNDEGYRAFLVELDHLRQRLLAMCREGALSSHANVLSTLVPELQQLVDQTTRALSGIAHAVRAGSDWFQLTELVHAEEAVDRRLQHLREARATSPFSLDRMLPFWAFLFNLKEVVTSLKSLNAMLGRIN